MLDFLEELILQAAGAWWMPLAVFLLSLIDGFFPVVPSESVLVALASISDQRPGISLVNCFCRLVRCLHRRPNRLLAGPHHQGHPFPLDAYPLGGPGDRRGQRNAAPLRCARRHHRPSYPRRTRGREFHRRCHPMKVAKFAILDFISAAIWAAYSLAIGYFTSGWLDNTILQIGLALVFAAILGGSSTGESKDLCATAWTNILTKKPTTLKRLDSDS